MNIVITCGTVTATDDYFNLRVFFAGCWVDLAMLLRLFRSNRQIKVYIHKINKSPSFDE